MNIALEREENKYSLCVRTGLGWQWAAKVGPVCLLGPAILITILVFEIRSMNFPYRHGRNVILVRDLRVAYPNRFGHRDNLPKVGTQGVVASIARTKIGEPVDMLIKFEGKRGPISVHLEDIEGADNNRIALPTWAK
jgi:hypothetical protein